MENLIFCDHRPRYGTRQHRKIFCIFLYSPVQSSSARVVFYDSITICISLQTCEWAVMVDRRLLRQIRRLAYPLSLAPLFAFLYCLAAAYQVAEVTVYTHCLVDNFAVSVSEAVSTPDTSLKVSQQRFHLLERLECRKTVFYASKIHFPHFQPRHHWHAFFFSFTDIYSLNYSACDTPIHLDFGPGQILPWTFTSQRRLSPRTMAIHIIRSDGGCWTCRAHHFAVTQPQNLSSKLKVQIDHDPSCEIKIDMYHTN